MTRRGRARILAIALLALPATLALGGSARAQGAPTFAPDAVGPGQVERRDLMRRRLESLPPAERRRLRMQYEALDEEGRARFRRRLRERGVEPLRGRRDSVSTERQRRLRERWTEASPEARERMRRRLREFDGPSSARMEPLRSLSREDRQRLRQRLDGLDAEESARVEQRIERFRSLPSNQQDELREALAELRERSAAERRRIERNTERWRALPPSQRAQLRERLRALKRMSPDERSLLLERLDLPEPTPQR
jgi:hypothetical protein